METILDLTEYRVSDLEKNRTENLMSLVEGISCSCKNALDIGARDGHFSRLLAGHFVNVTALDLQEPRIECKGVTCVKGDMTSLNFQDNSFEFVLCAEVLEHISPHLVKKACAELSRVSEKYILIGVPYKEDNRVGRTTCYTCGEKNPPWGHVNCFDEGRLINLFQNMDY